MTAKQPDKKPPTTNPNSVLKYSGMAFQMGACIVLGFFGGMKLDAWMDNKKIPVFTLFFGLLGVGVGIYISIKDFIRKK